MKVRLCGVDTGGHFTQEAYNYCRERKSQGVVALKGSSTRAAPVLNKGKRVDVSKSGKTIKGGVMLYLVGTDTLKRTIYARLKHEGSGPGVIHFGSGTTDEYLRGLTCERLVPRSVKGFQVSTWEKPAGARNEPLDLFVYCLAVLELLKRRYNRATMWDQLRAALNPAEPPPPPPELSGTAALESRQPRRRSGFVHNW